MEQSNGPRLPGGIPISSRLLIPEGAAFDPVRRAMEAIDAVHGDGDLPLLPVVRTRAVSEAGSYEWNARTGEPLRLRFSGLGVHPELTVLHEIGHFLDHQAFGRPGAFASEAGDRAAVMVAIRQSAATRALMGLRRRRVVLLQVGRRRETVPVDQDLVEYLLTPREQFARAYAQYIALVSGFDELRAQLRSASRGAAFAVYHSLWDDDDLSLSARSSQRSSGACDG